jgi:two-component system NtrC family response regulator
LVNYQWPGNVRELINVVKRIAILYGDKLITKSDLVEIMPEICGSDFAGESKFFVRINGTLNDIIKQCIEKTLEMTNGNQSQAAKILGVSRSFLWRKLKNL